MQRVLIATFLAALAVSAWDYVLWSSRLMDSLFDDPSGDSEIMRVLEKHLDGSGEYVIGEKPTPEELRSGEHTYAEISYTEEGPSWYRPDIAGRMIVVAFVSFLPAALLLFLVGGRLETFASRFLTVAVFGAASALWVNVSYLLVDGGGWTHAMAWFFHHVVSWCIAGGILAKIVRPEPGTGDRGTGRC